MEEQPVDENPAIRCRHCGCVFRPAPAASGVWVCGRCRGKSPNLRRHYRSVADLCVIGLVATLWYLAARLRGPGLDLAAILASAHAVLLALTAGVLYKARAPWASHVVRVLVAAAFVLALGIHEILPLLTTGKLNYLALVVYIVVFAYLFWLSVQGLKCTAPR